LIFLFPDKSIDGINQWSMIRGGKPSKRNGFVYSIGDKSAAIEGKFVFVKIINSLADIQIKFTHVYLSA
jgi:hypothetical protein